MHLLLLQICKQKGAFFHCDLAQMVGKIPVNVNDCGIDLASISSHKVLPFSFRNTYM